MKVFNASREMFRFYLLCLLALCVAGCQFPFSKRESAHDLTPIRNPCIVLALPASGAYAGITGQIKKGAELARQTLRQKGYDPRIENIDTSKADWLAQLDALPPMCVMVGGPIQEKNYLAAKSTGQLNKRIFFSFLPTLAKGDEGVTAWRFFPSQQDQIDALLAFAADELHVRTWGAFYPSDGYGQKMTALLEQTLAKRNMTLHKGTYNPNTPTAWAAALKPMLSPTVGEDGKTMIPHTPFEALFIPDSWKQMENLTGALLANGEDRLILLGPSLWEQGLAGKQVQKANRYALAVFPAAWNSSRAPQPLRGSGNNLWTALGYDFINFATRLGLPERPSSPQIMTRLAQNAASSITALAPIQWDSNGLAKQKLYLFQVTSAGITPLNINSFKQNRLAVSERAALRMQGWGNINPDTGETVTPSPSDQSLSQETGEVTQPGPIMQAEPDQPGSIIQDDTPAPVPQATQQVAPAPQKLSPVEGVMRSTPRSSYKLSLPTQP